MCCTNIWQVFVSTVLFLVRISKNLLKFICCTIFRCQTLGFFDEQSQDCKNHSWLSVFLSKRALFAVLFSIEIIILVKILVLISLQTTMSIENKTANSLSLTQRYLPHDVIYGQLCPLGQYWCTQCFQQHPFNWFVFGVFFTQQVV